MPGKKSKNTQAKKQDNPNKTNTRNTRSILHVLDGIRSAAAIGTLAWSISDNKHGLLATGVSEVVSEGLAVITALCSLCDEETHENKNVTHQLRWKSLCKLFGLAGGTMMIVDAKNNAENPSALSYVGVGLSAFGMFLSKVVPACYEPTNVDYQQIELPRVAPIEP